MKAMAGVMGEMAWPAKNEICGGDDGEQASAIVSVITAKAERASAEANWQYVKGE